MYTIEEELVVVFATLTMKFIGIFPLPMCRRNITNKIAHVKTINTAHRNAMFRRAVDVLSSIVVSNMMFLRASASTYTQPLFFNVSLPGPPSHLLGKKRGCSSDRITVL